MKKENRKKGKNQKRILAKQIQELNNHLPKHKKTLKELLDQKNPTLKTKKGEKFILDEEELKEIAKILPHHLHEQIKLPIYIESGKKYGKGNYRINGKAETRLIQRILENEEDIFKKEITINRIELRKIRNKLRTTTKYMFTVDLSELTGKRKNEMGRSERR